MEEIIIRLYEGKLNEKGIKKGMNRYPDDVRKRIKRALAILIIMAVSAVGAVVTKSKHDLEGLTTKPNSDNEIECSNEEYLVEIVPIEDGKYYLPRFVKRVANVQNIESIKTEITDESNDTDVTGNDIKVNSNVSKASDYKYKWWAGISILGMIIATIYLLYLSKKYPDYTPEEKKEEFEILESALNELYLQDGVEKLNGKQIDALVDAFSNRLDKIKETDAKTSKKLMIVLTVLGSCLSISFGAINDLGLDIYSWFLFAAVMCVCCALVVMPVYASCIFNPQRDKIKAMLNLLNHYRIYMYSKN